MDMKGSKLKKVAIVTLTKDFNYGNRLQNFAVEYILKDIGFTPVTFFNTTYTQYGKRSTLKRMVKFCLNWNGYRKWYHVENLFNNFNDRYIHFAESVSNSDDLSWMNTKYDYFITGSDQVWNSHWDYISGFEFLNFANTKPSVSLAASFGTDTIARGKENLIAEWLKRITNISVREFKGAELVKELTGRDVPVLVDPTMCIPVEEWRKMERIIKLNNNKKYILYYVLGEVNTNILSQVNSYAKSENLNIYILNECQINEKFVIGPQGFLYVIDNAEYVITDSFHGAVFSLIFKKQLTIIERKQDGVNMSSRIQTLAEKFDIHGCISDGSHIKIGNNFMDSDWQRIEETIIKEKNSFLSFLQQALS
jgi:hypothetical protein